MAGDDVVPCLPKSVQVEEKAAVGEIRPVDGNRGRVIAADEVLDDQQRPEIERHEAEQDELDDRACMLVNRVRDACGRACGTRLHAAAVAESLHHADRASGEVLARPPLGWDRPGLRMTERLKDPSRRRTARWPANAHDGHSRFSRCLVLIKDRR